jgi:hypothetical protein
VTTLRVFCKNAQQPFSVEMPCSYLPFINS